VTRTRLGIAYRICDTCEHFRRKHEDAVMGGCDRHGEETSAGSSCDRWKSLHARDYREERMDTR